MSPALSSLPSGPSATAGPGSIGPLSSPLDLRTRLPRPETGFDWIPLLDLILIGLLFGLVGHRIVFAPGLALELPVAAQVDPALGLDLPSASPPGLPGEVADAVLTVYPNMIFLEGRKIPLARLQNALENSFQERSTSVAPAPSRVLLVKLDRDAPVQQLLDICEIARAAGFARVQLAAEPTAQGGFPAASSGSPLP